LRGTQKITGSYQKKYLTLNDNLLKVICLLSFFHSK